jgi:hypothetical protein
MSGRRLAIVAILSGLAALASCGLIMNPGPFGFGGWGP